VQPSGVRPQCWAIVASSCDAPSPAMSMRRHAGPQACSLDWKKCGTVMARASYAVSTELPSPHRAGEDSSPRKRVPVLFSAPSLN
jgi:hypothetical protein